MTIQIPGSGTRSSAARKRAKVAQPNWEPRLFWKTMQVVTRGIHVPQRFPVGRRGPIHNGNDDAGDGKDRKECHLEAGIEQRFRIHDERGKRCNSQRIERVSFRAGTGP